MEFPNAFRGFLWMLLRLVAIARWWVGARFRILRKAAQWKKALGKCQRALDREKTKRLALERQLIQARVERDEAQRMLEGHLADSQGLMRDVLVWAGRQAVGYGPGEGIPEHIVQKAAQVATPKLTARQLTMRMTEEALNGTN